MDDSDCSMPCSGDADQPCGAGDRLTVYKGPVVPGPEVPPTIPGWTYLGCIEYVIFVPIAASVMSGYELIWAAGRDLLAAF